MEGSEGSPPPSLCVIRAAELFPKPSMEKEDNELIIPFQELSGEAVKYLGRTDDGVLALSNYRIFLLKNSTNSETSVPLGLIESAHTRDLFHLLINCKDASTVKCSFETAEQCSEWQRRLLLSVGVPSSLDSLFAFPFYLWTSDSSSNVDNPDFSGRLQKASRFEDDFRREVERLQFDLNGTWRISHANAEFKLCPSYPQMILVPCCISDETLQNVANFRGSRRLPAVVWRHRKNGAVIARCSQPEVGWLGWRNSKDEQLLKALSDACSFDRGEHLRRVNIGTSGESTPSSPDGSHEEVSFDEVRKILIVDARSYTSAVTNRARGGGCECIEYYPCAEIEFMNLGNIHVIRKSFHALRQLCASPPDVPNWLGLLEKTTWLQHLSGLLASSVTVCHAIEKKERPVLVHCSDGWDRTPQIVATAELCLDPFYRTVEGFRILVEREWLQFGHKFADRCGHGPGSDETNERCPVFLQWLDLVHQIHRQFPCSFEFSMGYLIKLAQHSHSCLFGTFLCNTLKERLENSVFKRTFSVWPFLSGPMYRNPLYVPNKERVLWPAHNVRDLALWTEVYLGSLGNQNVADFPPSTSDGVQDTVSGPMTKTRSYGDLLTAGINQNGLSRRSSDPNMTLDSNLMSNMNNSENSSEIDLPLSNREITSLEIANIIHDTTEKLQNLTNELNQNVDVITETRQSSDIQKTYDDIYNQILQARNFNDDDLLANNESNYENTVNNSISLENSSPKCESNNFNSYSSDYRSITMNGKTTNEINCIDVVDSVDSVGFSNSNESKPHPSFLESVDLTVSDEQKDASISAITVDNQNPWHGSVNTSTDTLVPKEFHNQQQCDESETISRSNEDLSTPNVHRNFIDLTDDSSTLFNSKDGKTSSNNILPEVHSKPNLLSYNSNPNYNQMDESILILPEHQKLEISSTGKCETINSNSSMYTSLSQRRRRTSSSNSKNDFVSLKNLNGSVPTSRFSTPGVRSLPLTPPSMLERPQIAISCPDGLAHALSEQNIRLQQIVHEHKVREDALLRELHGMRMALLKKTCPNCNNLPLSNEDQVDVMMYDENNCVEVCDNCSSNNHRRCFHDGAIYFGTRPDSAASALDNLENVSVCSWEAVEDKSGPSSCASSIQPGGSVLWVPDHAVSRCTSCQTEFWLGRRKHHCRSCGQIYCADCSEFWAPLPDVRLYTPVRLCGPCYHSVTTRMQLQQIRSANGSSSVLNNGICEMNLTNLPAHPNANNSILTSSTLNNSISKTILSTASTIEDCKHAASPPRNDRETLKATAISN